MDWQFENQLALGEYKFKFHKWRKLMCYFDWINNKEANKQEKISAAD